MFVNDNNNNMDKIRCLPFKKEMKPQFVIKVMHILMNTKLIRVGRFFQKLGLCRLSTDCVH